MAEWLGGELGRAIGLRVPELVWADLDPGLGDAEPDGEIQDLVRSSGGLNLGMDFLPGALTFNRAARPTVDQDEAAAIVWLDGLITNPDRTVVNPNLLVWHGGLWLIDHGAALYVHHAWRNPDEHARRPFERLREHVLLPYASSVAAADARLADRLSSDLIAELVAAIPELWLPEDPLIGGADAQRAAYRRYLSLRLTRPRPFIEEVERARLDA